jgi:hypothetical protein
MRMISAPDAASSNVSVSSSGRSSSSVASSESGRGAMPPALVRGPNPATADGEASASARDSIDSPAATRGAACTGSTNCCESESGVAGSGTETGRVTVISGDDSLSVRGAGARLTDSGASSRGFAGSNEIDSGAGSGGGGTGSIESPRRSTSLRAPAEPELATTGASSCDLVRLGGGALGGVVRGPGVIVRDTAGSSGPVGVRPSWRWTLSRSLLVRFCSISVARSFWPATMNAR